MLSDKFFASATKVHTRPITLSDGTVETVWFRELPWEDWFDYQDDMRSDDRTVRKAAVCRLVQASVCEPDGRPSFDVETARRINVEPLNNLLVAIKDIHGRGEGEKKAQPPEASDGSGMSSRSLSVAEQ